MRRWSKILTIGDPRLSDLFNGTVEITEKLDGSQINFGVSSLKGLGDPHGGLWIWSKGAVINPDQPPKLFAPAVEYIKSIQGTLLNDYSYHGEAVCSLKHNTLTYGNVPKNYIALYGVINSKGVMFNHQDIEIVSQILNIGYVPLLYKGLIDNLDTLKNYIDIPSMFGGCNAEGIVVKNYGQKIFFNGDDILAQGKYVTEQFKERHKDNPEFADPVDRLISQFMGESRWLKAVQRRQEDTNEPLTVKDIGPLIGYISKDFSDEEKDYVKDQLYNIFKKKIIGGVTKGFPEWFKERLLNSQTFESF